MRISVLPVDNLIEGHNSITTIELTSNVPYIQKLLL